MSNLHRELSIDAFYHVSVHMAKRFQRRMFKCEKLTNDGRQVIAKAHMVFGQMNFIPNINMQVISPSCVNLKST
jgi:hypothetical protein